MSQITRRSLIAGSALATLSTALPQASRSAAPPVGKQAPGFYRFKIGSYELTAITDGIWVRPVDDKFVRNAALPDVQKELQSSFLPTDKLTIPFTALVVNTGAKLVLIDTGTGGRIAPAAGAYEANLAAAGIDPKAVDVVLISHFHFDHINGLKTKDDKPAFPNAEINVPAPEWAFWMDDARMNAAPDPVKAAFQNVRRVFAGIGDNVRRFDPGKELAPGITSIPAYGHTPGHTVFAIASGSQSMLALCDTSGHPALFVRRPDWQSIFDLDGNMAAETRKSLFDRAAADRMLIQGYHYPFPASGYIAKVGVGFEFVPAQWSPAL